MKRKPRAGLLPLYLKLYDDTFPPMRNEFEPFLQTVISRLESEGIEVVRAPICRLQEEFAEAVNRFQQADADLIVTLHLAYSLSLESVEVLAQAKRPVLMLDTTIDFEFGPDVDPYRILLNHGVHGVQDLACMLRRRGVPYHVVAGHVEHSNVISRTAGMARAAYAARSFMNSRILRIGPPFLGMGDFSVEEQTLKRAFGFSVDTVATDALIPGIEELTLQDIEPERESDLALYRADVNEETHWRSLRVGLGLRRYLEQGIYNAFSLNFLAFDSDEDPVDTVPFLECSKAMARGVGYAGEGDVLTAGLVGALCRAFERCTFTEIFCPDWKGNSLFLSHMGEVNPLISSEKPLLCEKDFPWTKALNPAVVTCAPAMGPATLVNLAPGPKESFRLIIAPMESLEDTTRPELRKSVRGWIRPQAPLIEFLERYSQLGGTHHSALLLGHHSEALRAFASHIGVEGIVIA